MVYGLDLMKWERERRIFLGDVFYAHIAEDERQQTVADHLSGTARLAAEFADVFGERELGYFTGMAHDIGKFSHGFQKRLQGGHKVDHSSAGAWEAWKLRQLHAAFCIAGHHGGLPDGDILMTRVRKAEKGEVEDYTAFYHEVQMQVPSMRRAMETNDGAAEGFFIRMLFSCLVDADYLDTERFMNYHDKNRDGRNDWSGWLHPADMASLEKKLKEYVSGWFPEEHALNRIYCGIPEERRAKGKKDSNAALNQLRCRILEECMAKAQEEAPGIFSLTVPTGGGKTIASLAFALSHARAHGKKRIIFVIPYTSIIEQTAKVFRDILGEDQVLEHHSGVVYEDEGGSTKETLWKIKATENWDMPVIVTTAVQFFESMYSNKPSKCRKLHNMADSVIVFDEAQMLPIPYLRPCVHGIVQLVKSYRVTAVLCTATQPALGKVFGKYLPGYEIRELCPPELCQSPVFQRVTFHYAGKLEWKALAGVLMECHQVLCIVNSRKNASHLFSMVKGEGTYHLSTLMYPEHRRRILQEIRTRLEKKQACRVIATSLIEAGVDVDFPVVYREEAGLDSVLQAAGRCNREGKHSCEDSIVTVFQAENSPPQLFAIPIGAARSVMKSREEFTSGEAIHHYFEELLDLKGEEAQDQKEILKCMKGGMFPFQRVAKEFQLIESDTRTIYIPCENNGEALSKLRQGQYGRELFRELGRYGVSVYPQHYEALEQAGDLEILEQGSAVLVNTALYSEETGLSLEADTGKALFI